MSKPTLSYLSRDYETLLSEIKEMIPNLTDDWTDFSDGDVGMLLVRIMAAIKDMQAYQFDMQQMENFIDTVKQRSNLISIVKPYGYNLRSYRASKVLVHIPNSSYPDGVTPISAVEWESRVGTQFFIADESSSLIFTFLGKGGDVIPSTDGVDLVLYQGQLSKWPTTAQGTSTELLRQCRDTNGKLVTEVDAIAISDANAKVAIDKSSYLIKSNGVDSEIILDDFPEVSSFVESIADYANVYDNPKIPKEYRLFVDRDNKTYLQFFSTSVQVDGVDLLDNQIYIKFLLTEGADGLISTGTTLAFKYEGENISVETTDILDRGANPETIEEARKNIPDFVKTMDRAVSVSDYETIVKRYLKETSPTSGHDYIGVSIVDYYKNVTSQEYYVDDSNPEDVHNVYYQQIPDFTTEAYKVISYWLSCSGTPITSDVTTPNAYVYPLGLGALSNYADPASDENKGLVSYLETKRMVGIQLYANALYLPTEQVPTHPCAVSLKRVRFYITYRTRTSVNEPAIKAALSKAFVLRNEAFGTAITLSEVLNIIYAADSNIIIDVANGGLKMTAYTDSNGDNSGAPSSPESFSTDNIYSAFNEAVIYGGAIFNQL